MKTELEKFLFENENSRTKESLLNFKLFYDLKLAAALGGYDLSLYSPDVDRDGFDIILDDHDTMRKIQLKTVLKSAKTSRWNIHNDILRPVHDFCEQLGFEPTQSGTGAQGGIILMELDPGKDTMSIDYYYTDIFVITALRLRLVQKKPKITDSVFKNFSLNIRDGMSHAKVPVPKSFFVKAKTPEHLLGLMGFHNRVNHAWWHHLISIGEDHFFRPINDSDLPAPKGHLKGVIADQLIELTSGLYK